MLAGTAAAGAIVAAVWLGHATKPATVVTMVDPQSIVAPSPNADISAESGLSLRDAFTATPASRSADYAEAEATEKPKTVVIPREAIIARKMAKIQDSITGMLEGGPATEEKKDIVVGKGDTLMELLVRARVPRTEAHNAIAALKKYYDPRDLNPSQSITVFFHQDPAVADPQFRGLEIVKDKINTVSVSRTDAGDFTANQESREILTQQRAFEGVIDSSLYVSAKAAGVPDAVILDLIKMYSYHVDFQRDIQPGDSFRVLYQQSVTDAGDVIPGRSMVQYAQLTLGGVAMPLYTFKDSSGAVGFYDAKGKSAKKALMRTPIDGARISSGYGMRRHPVLGYSKMHKGVDFAAPKGTPIYASGDGVIEKMGPFSSYGNYIRLRHSGGMSTAYAHLSRFKSGLRAGARVKQGQVIGYVGSTGRSTGPHLHYEVMMNGKQVNPGSIKSQPGVQLAGKNLSTFKATVDKLHNDFQKSKADTAIALRDQGQVRTASN
jgi:murein DD-endopeptidase MepM/ murein hydrolase activator NlpD